MAGSRIAVAGLLTVAVLVGGCGDQDPGSGAGDPTASARAVKPNSPATGRPARTPEQIVNDPRSRLYAVRVRLDGTRVEVASEWACFEDDCRDERAIVVKAGESVEYLRGTRSAERQHLAAPRPEGSGRFAACAPVAGGVDLCDRQVGSERAVAWTADRGASWHAADLDLGNLLRSPAPSLRKGTFAVIGGGDGATLFPFERVARSIDDGASWRTVDVRRPGTVMPYVSGTVVTSDGRMLALIDNWSDDRLRRPSARPHGLHVSAAGDWSEYRPLVSTFTPALTSPEPRSSAVTTLGAAVEPSPVIWVTTWDDRLYVSTDDAASFREVATR
jgi:hypothetical protein